jgi:hypothetical protein
MAEPDWHASRPRDSNDTELFTNHSRRRSRSAARSHGGPTTVGRRLCHCAMRSSPSHGSRRQDWMADLMYKKRPRHSRQHESVIVAAPNRVNPAAASGGAPEIVARLSSVRGAGLTRPAATIVLSSTAGMSFSALTRRVLTGFVGRRPSSCRRHSPHTSILASVR